MPYINESFEPGHYNTKNNHTGLKITAIIFAVFIIVLGCIYAIGLFFFQDHFLPNTHINGIDVGMQTEQYADVELEQSVHDWVMTFQENHEDVATFIASDIDLQLSGNSVGDILSNQENVTWFMSFFQQHDYEEGIVYNEELLAQKVNELECVSGQFRTVSTNASVAYSESSKKFEIIPETIGNRIDGAKLVGLVKESINSTKPVVFLIDDKLYTVPEVTNTSSQVIAAADTANKMLETKITYTIDQTANAAIVDANDIKDWVIVNEDFTVALDEAGVSNYLSELGKQWDTVGKERTITTPTGKVATVSGGDYGWEIDEGAELAALTQAVSEGRVEQRDISYAKTAAGEYGADWGTTYIDLDISEQHMWYIKDGAVAFEADVVTGLPTPEKDTTRGVWNILEKEQNKTLVGELTSAGVPEYETPVAYWMRITWSGIGFHDATWQSSFGGNRYLSVGSHGCINMSLGDAATLYGLVEVGLPVVVHD